MSVAATELVPTYDFDQLAVSLKTNPDSNLSTLLSELAKIPVQIFDKPVVKKVDPAAVETLNEQMARSVEALPKVFGKTPLPATRRELRNHELAGYLAERDEIAAAKKALAKREELIKDAVSTHFDVVAEKSGAAKDGETPVDKNGHYLIGGSSKAQRLEARLPGSENFFVREKGGDTVEPNFDKLLKLYEDKKITRKEFLDFTTEVSYRVLDESALRRGLLSKARMERTQEIIEMISVVRYGTNVITVRK
ncbi:hypothetical protein [Streptomyces mirabilis]|uniref:hypothetical protein n=1 Tax=Streptomyces mirabilis TaxID=68239 RepID=UPI0036A56762